MPSHRLLAAVLSLAAALAVPAAAGAAREVTGTAYVFTRGFDVMYWDSVNGLRKISDGYEPSISSNGRYVVFARKTGAECRQINIYNVRTRRTIPLPGVNQGECVETPRLSGDGRYLVWSGPGGAGNPSDIFLYDVLGKRSIPVPAPVNTGSSEQSPSLSDDGKTLAFVSGRIPLDFDNVYVADISALQTAGTASLIPTPGLPTDGSQRGAVMSGDGSTIAYTEGKTLAASVAVYDRAAARMLDLPALRSGLDIYAPALTRSGQAVVVSRQVRDLGDRSLWRLDRPTGAFRRLTFLNSTLSDETPGVAEPVRLLDQTPPRVTLRCRAGLARATCRVAMNERGKAAVRMRLRGRTQSLVRLTFARAGAKPARLRTRGGATGLASVNVRAVDAAGNVRQRTVRVRIR